MPEAAVIPKEVNSRPNIEPKIELVAIKKGLVEEIKNKNGKTIRRISAQGREESQRMYDNLKSHGCSDEQIYKGTIASRAALKEVQKNTARTVRKTIRESLVSQYKNPQDKKPRGNKQFMDDLKTKLSENEELQALDTQRRLLTSLELRAKNAAVKDLKSELAKDQVAINAYRAKLIEERDQAKIQLSEQGEGASDKIKRVAIRRIPSDSLIVNVLAQQRFKDSKQIKTTQEAEITEVQSSIPAVSKLPSQEAELVPTSQREVVQEEVADVEANRRADQLTGRAVARRDFFQLKTLRKFSGILGNLFSGFKRQEESPSVQSTQLRSEEARRMSRRGFLSLTARTGLAAATTTLLPAGVGLAASLLESTKPKTAFSGVYFDSAERTGPALEEELRKKAEQEVIEQRREQSVRLIGGKERLMQLKEKAKYFNQITDKFMNLKVGNFSAQAAFMENTPDYADAKGNLPYGGGRASVETLQTEIEKRLRADPDLLKRITSNEDAERLIKDQRLGMDCAGFLLRALEDVYKKTGLGNFEKIMGKNIGYASASSFIEWGKQGKEGFFTVEDKATNILNPGTLIVLTEKDKPDLGAHAMMVIDVGISTDGYLVAKVAESTDISEGKHGVHVFTIKLIKPDAPLREQVIPDQLVNMPELEAYYKDVAEGAKAEGRTDYAVRLFYGNYVLIGNNKYQVKPVSATPKEA